ncbi:hypothetical protein EDD15DRAFT_956443 [Pisolithus albus]|nr:hypothetical protein EDD15DRAFT_956443 [Pisolithus albus]
MQPTEQIHPWIPFPYECPIPFQSNWTSYFTSDRYVSSLNTSSWSPQEHLTYPLHVHPSHTLSDHKMHLFRSPAAHISDYHTTGGGVDDCRHFDEPKFNTEQITGFGPQLPLSPRNLLSQDRAFRIKGRRRSRTFHHTHRSATARSRPTKLPCGWRDDEGKKCGKPISYDDCPGHFASAHGIRNKAWNVKVICRWCPAELYKVVTRKNFMRHMKEVHFCYARSENGN